MHPKRKSSESRAVPIPVRHKADSGASVGENSDNRIVVSVDSLVDVQNVSE